jgi:hypothetical protein
VSERNRSVTSPVTDSAGTIALQLELVSPDADRTYRRRRLGVLTGMLLVTLSVGSVLSLLRAGGEERDVSVLAAGDGTPADERSRDAAERVSFPVELVRMVAETTTTSLLESTTTSAGPATTTPPSTTTAPPTTASTTTSPPTTEASVPSTSAAPATTAAPAPATTAAPTTAPPPPPPPPSSAPPAGPTDPASLQVWLDLAQCESGGNWSINTGNGYYGGLQFSLATWQSVGGTGYPHEHGRDTQIEMGRRLQARAGWGAWPHCSAELGLR